MEGIRGKRVLVSGGSSGIGQAIAVRFAQEGADVAINYRKGKEEAQHTHELMRACIDTMQRCNADGKHILVQGDVAKGEDILRIVATTIDELGGLDILINNAGIQTPVHSHEMTAFLSSDEAAYITGQTLFVDGGLTLYPDVRAAWSSE
jgi:glucose 1-dehydrogenase